MLKILHSFLYYNLRARAAAVSRRKITYIKKIDLRFKMISKANNS
jgi:hypothetical protein